MTNSDKKDSIRRRMAQTGEPFNVARRKAEAAAAQPREGGDLYRLVEVEVGSDHDPAQRRHRETFRGRWIRATGRAVRPWSEPREADGDADGGAALAC